MRDMYAQRKNVYARRGQYTALPSWTAPCPRRRYRPTHIAVGTNLNSPAHMDALRETIGAAGGASTLPLAGERTGLHVQGRVAVHLTLPVDGERTTRRVQSRVAVKGWGLGTLGAEWQCGRDCQTGVSVPNRYARGRVAVKGWGLGTFGAEWQCDVHCHSTVNVPRVAFRAEWQCDRYARGRVAVKGWDLGTLGAE